MTQRDPLTWDLNHPLARSGLTPVLVKRHALSHLVERPANGGKQMGVWDMPYSVVSYFILALPLRFRRFADRITHRRTLLRSALRLSENAAAAGTFMPARAILQLPLRGLALSRPLLTQRCEQ